MNFKKLLGTVRGLYANNLAEGTPSDELPMNNRGDIVFAQGLPPLAELVRMGDSWQVALATLQAALTALPTTTAGLSLWNGEPANGKVYVIDSVVAVEEVVDATQQNQLALYEMNNVTPVTVPTDAALAIKSMCGRKYGGKARTLAAGTVVNDGWFPIGNSSPGSAAVAGGVWRTTEIPINGRQIVPPGGMYSVAPVKVAATASQVRIILRWHEVQLIYRA